MKYFDPHIHMTSRTTDDYQAMYAAGIRAIVEPAFWMGQPRTHVGTFEDYFLGLVGWERFRASQFGVQHFCTIGLNPKEANFSAVNDAVLELMPFFLEKDGVVAVGEIGYDDMTAEEEKYLIRQFELARAHELPALVHLPHRDKKRGCIRTMEVVKDIKFPAEQVIIDHNTEETVAAVLDGGFWAGHSIYPNTKMSEDRMVKLIQQYGDERMIINSAADWGISDPLKVPKTAQKMREAGIPEGSIQKICWDNPKDFFAQSGRLDLAKLERELSVDQRQLHEDNSVLRGQQPVVRENA